MKNSRIYFLATCALMAALLCIFGPMSVPIGPIPISLTNLVLYFAIFLLGTKGCTVSFIVYLLIGAVGLPVFSGYSGGLGKLAGPTGGYLIGFIPMVIIMGIIISKTKQHPVFSVLGMIIGTLVAYALGTAWFVYQSQSEWMYALSVCVVPFVPFDLAKMVVATILGKTVRNRLLKASILPEQEKK